MFALFSKTWFQKMLGKAARLQPFIPDAIYAADEARRSFRAEIKTCADPAIMNEAKPYLLKTTDTEKRKLVYYLLFCIARNTQDTAIRQYLVDEYYNPKNFEQHYTFSSFIGESNFSPFKTDISLLPKTEPNNNEVTEKLFLRLVTTIMLDRNNQNVSSKNLDINAFTLRLAKGIERFADDSFLTIPTPLAHLVALTGNAEAKAFLFRWFEQEKDKKQKDNIAIAIAENIKLEAKSSITQRLLEIGNKRIHNSSRAISAMRNAPTEEVEDFLLSIIEGNGAFSISDLCSAINICGYLTVDRSLPFIEKLLTHSKRDVRWNAVIALTHKEEFIASLLKVVGKDTDQHVKGLALIAVINSYAPETQKTVLNYAKKIFQKKIDHPYLSTALKYLASCPENDEITAFLATVSPEVLAANTSPEADLSGRLLA